jgi:superkiller protein 3
MLQRAVLCGLAVFMMLILESQAAEGQTVEQLFQQGNAAQLAGKYSEAEFIWQKVIRQDPKSAIAYNNLGKALYFQNKFDEATNAFHTAIQLEPHTSEAYNALGNALLAQKKIDEAIKAFRNAINLNPSYVNAYNNLGRALTEQGKFDIAIKQFRIAIQLDPKSVRAYNGLGNVLRSQNRLEEAIKAYQSAIQLDPKDPAAYYNFGIILEQNNQFVEATSAYTIAIKNASPYLNTLPLSSRQALRVGIEAYYTAIQRRPKDSSAYYKLGYVFEQNNQLVEAFTAYRGAIQLGYKASDVYIGLGNILSYQNKLDKSMSAYHAAIRLDPKSVRAYLGLGNLLFEHGILDEAIIVFRKVIQLDPRSAQAYNGLGKALGEQGMLDEAIEAFSSAIQCDPKSARAYNGLGNVLRAQNKLNEAIKTYRVALTLPEEESPFLPSAHTSIHNNLGLALQSQGNLKGAVQEFQTALKLNSEFTITKNNLKEAQRLLAFKQNPQPSWIDDTRHLPKLEEEPKLPVFRGTARIIVQNIDGNNEVAAGWVVRRQDNTAWIVTNRHVVTDNKTNLQVKKSPQVEFFSELPEEQRPRYFAKILMTTSESEEIDLAILQIIDDRLPKDIQALTWNTERLQANQRIFVVGHPTNKDNAWDSASGEVTSYSLQQPTMPINAVVAEGNSGGPIINEQNQVVGIFFRIGNKYLSQRASREIQDLEGILPATGDIGLAYRVEVVIAKLRSWKIIMD